MSRDVATIRPDSSAGGAAEPDYSGTALLTGWPCDIRAIGGDATFRGRMLEAHVQYVVTGNYVSGITPTCRLEVTGGPFAGRTLNIDSPRIVGDRGKARKWELYCTERPGR